MPDLDRPPKMVKCAPVRWCSACDCRVQLWRPFLDCTEVGYHDPRCRCDSPNKADIAGMYPTADEVPGTKWACMHE